jgi:hypothetical protein
MYWPCITSKRVDLNLLALTSLREKVQASKCRTIIDFDRADTTGGFFDGFIRTMVYREQGKVVSVELSVRVIGKSAERLCIGRFTANSRMVSSIGRVRWTKALFSPVPHGPR